MCHPASGRSVRRAKTGPGRMPKRVATIPGLPGRVQPAASRMAWTRWAVSTKSGLWRGCCCQPTSVPCLPATNTWPHLPLRKDEAVVLRKGPSRQYAKSSSREWAPGMLLWLRDSQSPVSPEFTRVGPPREPADSEYDGSGLWETGAAACLSAPVLGVARMLCEGRLSRWTTFGVVRVSKSGYNHGYLACRASLPFISKTSNVSSVSPCTAFTRGRVRSQ